MERSSNLRGERKQDERSSRRITIRTLVATSPQLPRDTLLIKSRRTVAGLTLVFTLDLAMLPIRYGLGVVHLAVRSLCDNS
ncbi:hypothetical protein J6590_001630 [Homalodisca vitripennis]|nr:hypothetical protein J6590_001630 [Homalodisca vitripennis]